MSQHNKAFTLIELIVATTIFVSLMGMVTFAFERLSNGGKKGLQILDLHTKADVIFRFMEQDLRTMPNVAALCLRPPKDGASGAFTFMRQVNDTYPGITNLGDTIPDYEPYENERGQHYRLTDLIWARWEWSPGQFSRGQSRINQDSSKAYQWQGSTTSGQPKALYTGGSIGLPVKAPSDAGQRGIQQNGIRPMLQRHFKYFVGSGQVKPTDASTGGSVAVAGDKLQVYKAYIKQGAGSDPDLFSVDANKEVDKAPPWRTPGGTQTDPAERRKYEGGDRRALYTILECGNIEALDGDNAYAVRNMDGQTVNKDRLNLLGATDTDDHGNVIYPSQIHRIFSGMFYFQIELIKRSGKSIADDGGETDSLADGAISYDISGVDPASGAGMDTRPIQIRVSYLLHSIPDAERDDLDIDGDGLAGKSGLDDIDMSDEETLAQAIYDLVESEGHANRLEKIEAFKRYALQHGHTAIYFSQSVQLGY